MAKKKFRIATEGATTDGREITRSWIEQMARNYDPKKYGARINLEHLRGILPDGPFKSYGDVVSLSTEEVTVDGEKRLALLAELDPTPDLVELSKKRQKVYTSMEVHPDFAKSGEAYLVGLAITDSPASLGTEMLQFAAGATVNPFAERKQSPETLFTEAVEIELDFEDVQQIDSTRGLFTRVKELLSGKSAAIDVRLQDTYEAVEALAENASETSEAVVKFAADLAKLMIDHVELQAAHDKLAADFAALSAQLDTDPAPTTPRPAATGGDGAVLTDC